MNELISAIRPALGVLLLAALVQTVHAQPAPDAGALLQQIEKERATPAPATSVVPAAPAASASPSQPGPTVVVTAFRFTGNTRLGDEALARAVAPFLQRPLDFNELQRAAVAAAEAYRESGWIVRAYLPRQDIKDGIVTIQIVEAILGTVRIEGEPPRRLSLDRVRAMVAAAQAQGAPLNANAIDRALLLINDMPGVRVASASLDAGQHENETDLVLSFADVPLASGEVTADNTGSASTGAQRASAVVFVGGALRMGDQLTTHLVHSQGSDYARLALALPLGNRGWRVGANVSAFQYDLVAPAFAALGAKGKSSSVGLETSYPLIRSRTKNLAASLSWDRKAFRNETHTGTTSDYELSEIAAGLTGSLLDDWGAGGANSASLVAVQGQVDLSGSPNEAADASTTQTAGSFTILRYAASREQVLNDKTSLYAALSGQFAGKNLDSSEKFYLGGASGVRAYPSSEGGGAEGQLLSVELRRRLRDNLTLAGFYDRGQVTVNRNNDFSGAAGVNRYSLQGAGVSLGWTTRFGLRLKGTVARRIGDNPNPTLTGTDQDGTLLKTRFWFEAALPF